MCLLKIGLASIIALTALGLVEDADAGSRWKFRYYDFYSAYEDDSYEEDFDQYYYEPQYMPKKKMKKPQYAPKKKVKRAPQTQITIPSTKKKTAAKQPAQSQAKKQNTSISCDRASKIVAGYGFASVRASNCEGKEFAFAATRDGKNYIIKMSSANGELTQVKKQ